MGGTQSTIYRGGVHTNTPFCSFHLLLSRFTIWKVLLEAEFWSFSLCFHEYCPPSGSTPKRVLQSLNKKRPP